MFLDDDFGLSFLLKKSTLYSKGSSRIVNINTCGLRVRVLSRPQHGMWPTRWLHGPLFVSRPSDILPAEVETNPTEPEEQESKPLVSVTRWCQMFYLFFYIQMLKSLSWVTSPTNCTEMNCHFPQHYSAFLSWNKGLIIAWQTCSVDCVVISLQCCRERD